MVKRNSGLGALLLSLAVAGHAQAQQRTATVTAGAQYGQSEFAQLFIGKNWRDLWTTPVRVPVLALTVHGGLTPLRTGGRQSKTLHFQGGDGRRYVFRSVDKWLHREALPPDVRHTPMGNLIQDQISMLMPGAGLVPAPIQDAAGVLQSVSTLVVLPDDPRLGEFREEYKGLLGQFEENPNEGPDDAPGFAGSRKVHDTEDFLEAIDESPANRLKSDEYLKARLVDFLIGDTDRGGDQWKFARFPQGGGHIYRPVPRDHDFAMMVANGLFAQIATRAYPKLANFNETYEKLRTLTFMTHDMDRRLLVDIPRTQWDSIVAHLKAVWTDDVLRASVGRLPQEYQPHAAQQMLSVLIARRNRLHEPAAQFYNMVVREAEVHGTAEAERAEIVRNADGSLDVRLYGGPAAGIVAAAPAQPAPADGRPNSAPYFQRRFLPNETREVRVYLHGGDDNVRVSGTNADIGLRVIAGDGDDVLEDVSTVGRTTFYTAGGSDRVTRGAHTRVDDSEWDDEPPGRPEDMKRSAAQEAVASAAEDSVGAQRYIENAQVGDKLSGTTARDWGSRNGTGLAFGHRSGVGIVLGLKQRRTAYGFRRTPYKTDMMIQAMYAPETNGFGVEFEADRRFENSPRGLSLLAHATQFESFRFFGWGNDTEEFEGNARVRRDEIAVRPALSWWLPQAEFSIGPVVRYGRARFDENTPLDLERPLGSDDFAQAGAWAEARFDRGATDQALRRGLILEAGGSAYPALLDVPSTYGEAHALARSYITLPGLNSTFLALRAGGQKLFGDEFPVHDAALLGGRHTVRGHTTDRFAGDGMVYGGAELHVPITRLTLLVRGRLGAFALADAGRVYFEGASPGGWHTALGGGLTFATIGQVVSLTYAKGERGRFYLELGLPF
jgi:hypothetical protein